MRIIGEGGSSNIVLCKCKDENTNWAVKSIKKEYITNTERERL